MTNEATATVAATVFTTPATFAATLPTMEIGGQFAHITSEKVVGLKKGNEGVAVMIRRENTVQLGTSYSKVVKDRAKKEDVADTENVSKSVNLHPLPTYLERVNKFVTRHINKGTLYLSAMPVSAKVSYHLDGEAVDLESIRHMMYAKDLPKKSSQPKTQGTLLNAVEWRRYSLDNVVCLNAKGQTFIF